MQDVIRYHAQQAAMHADKCAELSASAGYHKRMAKAHEFEMRRLKLDEPVRSVDEIRAGLDRDEAVT